MKAVNVLITASSRRVPLVRAFRAAAERAGKGRIITTDVNPLSPALYFGHSHHIVPLTTDRFYIPIIQSICSVHDVHLVIPTIDDELPIFGRHRKAFADNGISVAVSSEETGHICNDKLRTYQFCVEHGFATPKTWLAAEVDCTAMRYPAVVKPRFGRGSVDVHIVHNEEQLRFFARHVENGIVQEFAEGLEFTVDVLADFSGRVLSVVPRERLVIRAGVSDKGITRKHEPVIDFVRALAEELCIVGPANFQCKWDGRKVSLIEVNPRFSGGIPLTIAAGADFPRWLIELHAGRTVEPRVGRFQDGLTMMSFEDSIFAPESELTMRPEEPQRMLSRKSHASAFLN